MNGLGNYVAGLDAPETKPMSKTRQMVLSALLALGIGASASNVIPTKTHADESKNNAAKMSQDGGGY